jgi:predicted negative regulator of RcsB-dependent stress response
VSIARRSSPDGTLFDHIGDVLFRLKRFDKAKEAWLEAQKHIEDNKMGQKLSATLKTKLENLDKMPKPPQNNKLPNP